MEQSLIPGLPGKVCGFPPQERINPELPDSVSMGIARSGSLAYGVVWSQQYGAKCPGCGKYQKIAYKHSPWQHGRKTRYHRCPGCGYRFKSLAEDVVRFDFPPAPDELIFLRRYDK
jgi:Zn ribbon nucleic-acid-binding protein